MPRSEVLMDDLTVTIPGCPDPALSPNARVHWSRRMQATRDARIAACVVVRSTMVDDWRPWPARSYVVDAVIAWGAGRKRMDPTNLSATLKGTLDGVADGMGVNDKHFAWGTVTQQRAEKGDRAGWVKLTITAA